MQLTDIMDLSEFVDTFEKRTGASVVINIDSCGMHIRLWDHKERIDKHSLIPIEIMQYIEIDIITLIQAILNSFMKEIRENDKD